jgi:hypothetical protein
VPCNAMAGGSVVGAFPLPRGPLPPTSHPGAKCMLSVLSEHTKHTSPRREPSSRSAFPVQGQEAQPFHVCLRLLDCSVSQDTLLDCWEEHLFLVVTLHLLQCFICLHITLGHVTYT